MNTKSQQTHLKYGGYESNSFYYPSFMDMKDPYFVQLREQFFEDINKNNKRFGVKTEYRIPYSEDIVVDDDSLQDILTLLQ